MQHLTENCDPFEQTIKPEEAHGNQVGICVLLFGLGSTLPSLPHLILILISTLREVPLFPILEMRKLRHIQSITRFVDHRERSFLHMAAFLRYEGLSALQHYKKRNQLDKELPLK